MTRTYFDPRVQAQTITVLPGEYKTVNSTDQVLVTILGSCVAACIRDPIAGIGGINHFLLAQPSMEINSPSNRYGCFAMECLINEILTKGGQRNRLEVKVFGGADLFQSRMQIGSNNIAFVRNFFNNEKLTVVAEDLGGNRPRRIHYWPGTGKVIRHILAPQIQIVEQEKMYQSKLAKEAIDGSIELFT